MRIWTRKSASIQPRTSLRKSDVTDYRQRSSWTSSAPKPTPEVPDLGRVAEVPRERVGLLHDPQPVEHLPPDTPILTPLFLRNFGGLVLGCIDTSDSESRRSFQHFSISTRFAFLCTALKSEIQDIFVAIFCKNFT